MNPDLKIAAESVIRTATHGESAIVIIVSEGFYIFRNVEGEPEVIAQVLEAAAKSLRSTKVKTIVMQRPS